MEKALYIANLDKLNKETIISNNYERVYFGNEFCGRNIPCKKDISEVITFCLENKLKFTLLTPFATELEIQKIADILKFICNEYNNLDLLDFEVSINDFGVFDHIKQHNYKFKINMGRVLTHQKKDPDFFIFRDSNIKNNTDSTMLSHIKGSSVDSNEEIANFVKENFNAIELENTFQRFHVAANIKIYLFYPMVSVTTTRYCIFASKEINSINATQFINCNKLCNNEYMINDLQELKMYLRGNTQFYYNNKLPENQDKISRLINYDFTY